MKKIFFLIAVFFSFAGYAQTVGQLRYDTVKMYKVGGTTELIIQNATKDRTNAAFKNMGNGRGAWENVVDSVFKNATADSFVYYIGGVRRAFKDSIGTGSFARDTIVAGRGLTGTPITATKVQIDNDSGYYAGIIRDDTLVLYRYNGDSTEFTLPSGGGGTGWGLTGNAISSGDFLGTTNNEPLVFKFNGTERGIIGPLNTAIGSYISAGVNNSGFGNDALLSATANTDNNTAVGAASLQVLTNGDRNVAVGYNSLSGITAGVANTAIGAETTLATTSSTDSAIAIGFEASAGTRQLAFSPHVTEIKATGITGASNSGYVLTTNGSGIATFQAASASSPAGNYGNIQINRNGAFNTPASDSLTFSSATLAVKGALTTTGAITASGNVSGNLFLATSGVRSNNNTNIYWNSGPVILGNTNDITLKNASATAGANVSIGTSAAVASAILDVNSTTKGALLPRMTGAEAEAISSPATGLIIYCTNGNGSVITSVGLWNYNGTAWVTAGAKPYQVIVGNLTSSGTSITFTQFENTTGTTITATRSTGGVYTLTSSGAPFTANKTQVYINNGVYNINASPYSILSQITSTSVIEVTSWDLSAFSQIDDILDNTSIEIRIYP